MTVALALVALTAVSDRTPQSREPIVQTIPGTVVSFRMMPVPDGSFTTRDGKVVAIKNLAVAEHEVVWDLFDIWAFRLDMSEAQQVSGLDAESRPSRPYGSPDWGFGHAGYPAIGMTHHAATVFCQWLSAKTGRRYRLPTEAEWEYAARAGATETPKLADVAWYWDTTEDKTQPVGKKRPNPWGLYDTLGNVAEWANGLDGKPITCGGSFVSKAADVGFAARMAQQPKWNDRDPQNPKSKWWLCDAPFVGFRLVLDTGP